MDNTSLSLLDRLRQPTDSKTWERFVDLYAPLLRVWLRAYGLQDADADDLIQDVLAAVAREIHRFEYNRVAI